VLRAIAAFGVAARREKRTDYPDQQTQDAVRQLENAHRQRHAPPNSTSGSGFFAAAMASMNSFAVVRRSVATWLSHPVFGLGMPT